MDSSFRKKRAAAAQLRWNKMANIERQLGGEGGIGEIEADRSGFSLIFRNWDVDHA